MPRVLLEIKLHNKCQVSVSCFHSLSCIFLQFFENTFLGVGGCLLFGKENVFLPHTKAFFLRCLQMPRKWYMLNTQLKATQVSGNWPEVIQKNSLDPVSERDHQQWPRAAWNPGFPPSVWCFLLTVPLIGEGNPSALLLTFNNEQMVVYSFWTVSWVQEWSSYG